MAHTPSPPEAPTLWGDSDKALLKAIGRSGCHAMRTNLAHKVLSKLPDPQIIAMNGKPCTKAVRSE